MLDPKRVTLCLELFVLGGLIGDVWQNCLQCAAEHITLCTEKSVYESICSAENQYYVSCLTKRGTKVRN